MPRSQPSVAVGSVSVHRISALFEHVNVLIVRASSLTMPSSRPPVDGTPEMDDLASLLRQLSQDRKEDEGRRKRDRELRRQDDERLSTQIFEMMDRRDVALREVAPGCTNERVGTVISPGEVRGVSSSGSLPALGEAVSLPRTGASSSVDSHRAKVGTREFGSLKQSVPSGNISHSGRNTSRYLLPWMGVCLRPRMAWYDDRRRFERHSIFSLARVQ